jgi:uncharacterized membrane protein
MSGTLRWLLVTAALAVVIHVAAVMALPYAIMRVVMRQAPDGWNHVTRPPLATAASRAIVRPSPDLAYTLCVFDVAERPLHVRAPVADGYTSLSMFAANTDNFFVVNDRQANGEAIDLVLVGPHTPPIEAGGRQVVVARSERGVILVRRVVESREHFAAIDELRRGDVCAPLTE